MDTKIKADVAEYAVIKELLKKNFNVLKPIGDRLPYDIAVEKDGKLIKIQVKYAWYDKVKKLHAVDARRTKTNRRRMLRKKYSDTDFDFAIIYIPEKEIYYIIPVAVFNSYASTISLVEENKRQRPPKAAQYRENWNLLVF
ncbi:MAG: endonuclease [Candidatus Omnitrophica bacterium]|nr:endonuclease [Candidatus Omnitrophota bacterium]